MTSTRHSLANDFQDAPHGVRGFQTVGIRLAPRRRSKIDASEIVVITGNSYFNQGVRNMFA